MRIKKRRRWPGAWVDSVAKRWRRKLPSGDRTILSRRPKRKKR